MQRRPRFITQGGLENLHHLPRDKTTVLLFPTSRKQSSGATLSNIHCTKLFPLEVGTLHYGRGEDKKQYFISKQILTNIFCCQYFSSKAQRTQRRVRRVVLTACYFTLTAAHVTVFSTVPSLFEGEQFSTECQTWQNWEEMCATRSLMFFFTQLCHCLLIPNSMGTL